MALGHNTKHLMDVTSTSYSDIAQHCGTDPQAIQALVKRNSSKSNFATGIASYFKVPLDLLINGSESAIDQYLTQAKKERQSAEYPTTPTEELREPKTVQYLPAIPVTHTLNAGNGEFCSMQLLSEGGQILWPLVTKDAYALKVQGDHLAPRARHGEYLLIDPIAEYSAGDEVAAQLAHPDAVYVGVYLYQRDGLFYFEDINLSGKKTSISETDILNIHLIAGYAKNHMRR
jgi:phage repressor protein C with HTH and peptisase S24 domain